jgi:hypothetical protein
MEWKINWFYQGKGFMEGCVRRLGTEEFGSLESDLYA